MDRLKFFLGVVGVCSMHLANPYRVLSPCTQERLQVLGRAGCSLRSEKGLYTRVALKVSLNLSVEKRESCFSFYFWVKIGTFI